MPVQEFLGDFFPVGQLSGLNGVPSFTPNCYRDTVSTKKEKKLYQHFVSLQWIPLIILVFKVQLTQEFAPRLRIVNTSLNNDCNPRSDFPFDIKPNVSVYRANSQPNVKTDSSLVELFIEFKWNPSDNPFCDVYQTPSSTTEKPQMSFLHETNGAIDTLGGKLLPTLPHTWAHSFGLISILFWSWRTLQGSFDGIDRAWLWQKLSYIVNLPPLLSFSIVSWWHCLQSRVQSSLHFICFAAVIVNLQQLLRVLHFALVAIAAF